MYCAMQCVFFVIRFQVLLCRKGHGRRGTELEVGGSDFLITTVMQWHARLEQVSKRIAVNASFYPATRTVAVADSWRVRL